MSSADALPPEGLDGVRRAGNRLMFPDVQGKPPDSRESVIRAGVSTLVHCKFSRPPLGVVLRSDVVLRTSMPETTVHEDSQPGSSERKVGSSWNCVERHSKSHSPPVQLSAKSEFRLGVPPGHLGELVTDRLAQRERTVSRHNKSVRVRDRQ